MKLQYIMRDMMVIETKISKGFQTVVPSNIRKMFKVGPGDIVEWKTNKNNRVEVFFRKKITINDVLGMIDGPKTDAVEMKKRIQRGEKI